MITASPSPSRAYPAEVVKAGAALLRALAERAAARGRVHEMLEFLAQERRLLTADEATAPTIREAPHG